jgi:hypothetical protein
MHVEIKAVIDHVFRTSVFITTFLEKAIFEVFAKGLERSRSLAKELTSKVPEHMMVPFAGKDVNIDMGVKKLVHNPKTQDIPASIASLGAHRNSFIEIAEHFGIKPDDFPIHQRTKEAAQDMSLAEGLALTCLALKSAVVLISQHKSNPLLHKYCEDWERMSAIHTETNTLS